MKQALRYLLLLLLAVTLNPARTFSQQVNDKQADEALRQRAYKLLESLAGEIGSLQSGENRARMGSNIASSLWPHNETKARQMFATVTKEIKAASQDEDPNRYTVRRKFAKLREDTALRIAMFDPEWALRFLKESTPIDVYISDTDQNNLNIRLAMVCAKRNPDVALKLGRESLNKGFSEILLSLIYELEKQSRDHASALLADIVQVVPNQGIRFHMQNEQLSFSLARLVEPTLGRDPAFRDLMKYFTDLALETGCGDKKHKDNDGFCYRLGLVVPLMEKVDPKRVAPLKHLGRRAAFPYEWSPELSRYAAVYERGSVDDLFAMIPKFPQFSDFGRGVIIRKIIEAGDFERARKLANEFPWQEPSSKQDLLEEVDAAQRIVDKDTSEELLRTAKELSDEGDEFSYLFRMATQIGPTNRQTTTKLLDRASELVDKVLTEKRLMQYRIGIAVRYCQVKSDRCFSMMEPVIRKMNELVSAGTKLDGFDNYYLQDGEWNMTAEGGVGSLLTMLAQNAVHFALCDLDRAITLSSLFERREIRMMAQLKLAQGVLDGPPKKPFFAVHEY